jgi:hypothetical protein
MMFDLLTEPTNMNSKKQATDSNAVDNGWWAESLSLAKVRWLSAEIECGTTEIEILSHFKMTLASCRANQATEATDNVNKNTSRHSQSSCLPAMAFSARLFSNETLAITATELDVSAAASSLML